MKAWHLAAGALLVIGCAAPAKDTAPAPPQAAPPASVDQATRARAWTELSSKLAGSWEASVKGGYVRVVYQPISNGTALLERFFTVSGKETASVYHPAGDRLLVTHYCAQGNQPRLQLTRFGGGELAFDFIDATDLDKGEGFMKRLVVTLRENAFDQTAIYNDGNGADESTTLHFVRAHEQPAATLAPLPEREEASLTCSEAFLRRAEVKAAGLGKKHPDVLALDALLAQCSFPIEIPRSACTQRMRDLDALLQQGLGVFHPDVTAARFNLAACEEALANSPHTSQPAKKPD